MYGRCLKECIGRFPPATARHIALYTLPSYCTLGFNGRSSSRNSHARDYIYNLLLIRSFRHRTKLIWWECDLSQHWDLFRLGSKTIDTRTSHWTRKNLVFWSRSERMRPSGLGLNACSLHSFPSCLDNYQVMDNSPEGNLDFHGLW